MKPEIHRSIMPSSPRVAAATRWKLVQHWQKTCTWMCVQAVTHLYQQQKTIDSGGRVENSVSVFQADELWQLTVASHLNSQGQGLIGVLKRMGRPRGKAGAKEARLLFFASANVRPLEEVHSPQVIVNVFLLI